MNFEEFRSKFQSFSSDEKKEFLKKCSAKELDFIWDNPSLFLFPKQVIESDHRYIILLTGRGFGKSIASANWLAKQIIDGSKVVGMCGATYDDVYKIMIPLFINWFRDEDKPKYNGQSHVLNFDKGRYKGTIVYCLTSDKESRGFSLEKLWCDELVQWSSQIPDKIRERFDTLDLCVRAGKNPQTIISSTPKNFEIFKNLRDKSILFPDTYRMIRGSTLDNPFLPKSFIDAQLSKHRNSRYALQELEGEILDQVEGALFTRENIDQNRIDPKQFDIRTIQKIIIGIDPAATDGINSDETGIVVAGISNNTVFILEDASGKYKPIEWASKAVSLFEKYKANSIVAEINCGGQMVEHTLRSINKLLPLKLVHAKKSKMTRFEPVSSCYFANKVKHVGMFKKLEDQMCNYDGNPKMSSPDHADAMAYCVTELLLVPTYRNRDFENLLAIY